MPYSNRARCLTTTTGNTQPAINAHFGKYNVIVTQHHTDTSECWQVCRWEFLAFSGTFKTLLNVHEEPEAGKVVFSLIKSAFMKDFEGQWQVTAASAVCQPHAYSGL